MYNADLFSEERMAELVGQYIAILRQVTARAATRVSDLDMTSGRTCACLPDPRAPLFVASHPSIGERLREHAAHRGDAIAVADRRRPWTFAQLDRASDGLAATLRAGGVGAGDVVAVYAHRSAPFVVALSGILKSGAAFAVLDPAHPEDRLAHCVAATRPAAFLTIADAGEVPALLRAALSGCLQISVDSAIERDVILKANVARRPDDLAYVAFTSGTTGGVKAVAGSERPLTHVLEWHRASFGLGAGDRFCLLSGLGHDPALRDIFAPLWVGATLLIPGQDELTAPDRLAA